ncbi:hypothetical protein ALO_18542 [Acetonema longum DSM 6540]|uniref:Uncharacterized protein n=1 Tax=Acetonema longum DSM 6540 TaxID=1009370 RepID=F7NNL7_9FIRM|nr:hypothetical protein ALO_18542 [Acetonema longum DSM 6540]
MEELKSKRLSVTEAMVRQETLNRMKEITEALRSMDTMRNFDENAGRAHSDTKSGAG